MPPDFGGYRSRIKITRRHYKGHGEHGGFQYKERKFFVTVLFSKMADKYQYRLKKKESDGKMYEIWMNRHSTLLAYSHSHPSKITRNVSAVSPTPQKIPLLRQY